MTTHYFIFAGESSGDMHGSCLIQALKAQAPASAFFGVGGPAMRLQGMKCILKMEDFQVMGFSDVIKALPKLYKQFYIVLDAILAHKPDCVILIDYPGLNLRLAKKLRQKGFKGKIVQYICPTVWAHGKERIELMAQHLDLLLAIFPFEPPYFSHTSLKVKYVGNPLVEHIGSYCYDLQWKKQMGISTTRPLIALFPGSRIAEIKRNFPLQIQVAELMKKAHPDLNFAVCYAHRDLLPSINGFIQNSSFHLNENFFLMPKSQTYELMQNATCALAKAGTVALELALHNCPSVVVYQLSTLNYLIAKYKLKLKLPHYCIVNILAGKEVFPEFMGKKLSAEQIYTALERLYSTEKVRNDVVAGCKQVQNMLGNKNAHREAAESIRNILTC